MQMFKEKYNDRDFSGHFHQDGVLNVQFTFLHDIKFSTNLLFRKIFLSG